MHIGNDFKSDTVNGHVLNNKDNLLCCYTLQARVMRTTDSCLVHEEWHPHEHWVSMTGKKILLHGGQGQNEVCTEISHPGVVDRLLSRSVFTVECTTKQKWAPSDRQRQFQKSWSSSTSHARVGLTITQREGSADELPQR
jgi:hypothetical protein